jgi:hypothetical protein
VTFRILLREPLVRFLGIGLLLFGLYALVTPVGTGGETITISRASVADMVAQHQKLWGRAPNPKELQGLIDSRVEDEILYREGLALGLDREDAVIKRRVRQNYELMAEEEAGVAPSEADLAAYLNANTDRFRAPPIVGFTQVLVPADGSAVDVEARAAALKAALAAGADPALTGKPTLLPGRVQGMPLDLVARDFGETFADALATLPQGQWAGPVASPYGLHLVRIDRLQHADAPALESVRAEVRREWENERRLKARATRLAELRVRYDIVVEQ